MTERLDLTQCKAGKADRARVVRVLTDSFADDPVLTYLLPRDIPRRQVRLRMLFDMEVRRSLAREATWIADDGAGALVCFPPGQWQPSRWEALRDAARWRYVLGPNMNVAGSAISLMEKQQRSLPDHWFLCYAGVDPARRTRGLATAMLEAVLAQCDITGTPAYMEASNPVSRTTALKRGFVDMPPLTLPGGGPTIHPLWRE